MPATQQASITVTDQMVCGWRWGCVCWGLSEMPACILSAHNTEVQESPTGSQVPEAEPGHNSCSC